MQCSSMLPTAVITCIGLLVAGKGSGMTRDQAIRLAEETLRRQLSDQARKISVRSAVPVDWPDASLGCPHKGMVYAQVITPGYRVVLVAGRRKYEFHVGAGRAESCESAGVKSAESQRDFADIARMSERAREDLAKRLGISVEDVKVRLVRRVTWPDTSLGCPEPGHVYAQVATEGFLIELEAKRTRYSYHTDRVRRVCNAFQKSES
jgi:hypothetical protein